jgi:signal transduction histidine kinase/HAMP domain-containing protein
MQFIPTLFPYPKFIHEPGDLVGWLGWFLFLFFILWLTNRWKNRVFERIPNRGRLFVFLLLIVPLTTLIFGIQIGGGLHQAGAGLFNQQGVLFVFSAIPWVLAAGLVGILPAMVIAGFSGLIQGVFITHSLFSPLAMILLALVYGYLLHQNFRTRFFCWLRHPILSAIFSAVLFFPLVILVAFISTTGSLAIRLDFSLTQAWQGYLMVGIELILAGIAAEILYQRKRELWFVPPDLVPSPIEKSLRLQFLIATLPFLIAILVSLAISIWVMGRNVALQIIREDLINKAALMSEDIGGLVEKGQSTIQAIDASDLLSLSPEEFAKLISKNGRAAGFFSEVVLIDGEGSVLDTYPTDSPAASALTLEEIDNVNRVLDGMKPQVSVAPRADGDIEVSFLRTIDGGDRGITGILLGRTQFALNQDREQLFAALNTFERNSGNAILINGGMISLEDVRPELGISNYVSWSSDGTGFFDWSSPKGIDSINYFQPIPESDWSLILNVPYAAIAQKTFSIAFPLLFITAVLILGAIAGLMISLNRVSDSLKSLSTETNRMAKGDLTPASAAKGEDEVGRLGQSFDEMRSSLRARLEELNHLVRVSKGVASSLDIEKSLQGVLTAAMGTRGSSARIILIPEVTLKAYPDGFFIMKDGTLTDVYGYFDRPLFEFMKHQELLALPKPSRMRRLEIPEDRPTPTALIARALHHEDKYYGVLWVGYEQSREFTEEEVQFINMLGDQASLAASNAALYCSTEISRQRLEAVLASAPEPILVFDEKDQLLMLNPAARDLHELVTETSRGSSLEQTLTDRELIGLIRNQAGFTPAQREISLRNKRVFNADISPVYAQGSMIGKICTLREITAFKRLDNQKTEFVETVSHDLRSPLSMLKGYATMMPMLGELNEQQQDYLKKINSGIDGMNHLVSNLLDLGRLEAGEGIKPEFIAASSIVDRVVKSLLPEANHKSIILEAVLVENGGQKVYADPALLQQALFNLVENAVHFTNVGGRVDIGYTVGADKITFFVKDTGIGISPIDLPGIFNPQPPTLVERVKANGGGGTVKLGLKIVKTIVEKHHGSVRVESVLGRGSTFYLEIPNPSSDQPQG